MANDAIIIQPKQEGFGQIVISNQVIRHIVMITIDESKHVFFDDNKGKRSVTTRNVDNVLVIDVKVRIQYGQNVEKVSQKLQNDLQRNLELMVDYKSPIININVVGFKFN